MSARPDLDDLLEEAARRPLTGWDLSYGGRIASTAPWDFAAIVAEAARASPDLLDIGTGGGEWLAALPHRPARTVAVEGWAPNVPVARERLAPLGVEVLAVVGAADNYAETPDAAGGDLPFPDLDFHLVVSRHEAYLAAEVRRVLASGGRFLTQQVGGGAGDAFYRLLDQPLPEDPSRAWTLAFAVGQVEAAGLVVEDAAEGCETMTFADVGALAWYLAHVPFVYDGFSIAQHRDCLGELHGAGAPIAVNQPLFRLTARRP